MAHRLYVKWNIRKPSTLQRVLNAIDGKQVRDNNDKTLKLRTTNTDIKVSTYQSTVIMHQAEDRSSGKVQTVGEEFDLSDYNSKDRFTMNFAETWLDAVQEMKS